MKKTWAFLLIFFIVSIFIPAKALAQNKAGINIGANHQDLERAAEIVGQGGWIVFMGCPSDGDKIAEFALNHPEINLIIRGHFPGVPPTKSWAKAWAATLGAIPFRSKVYFMPWNEPNQEGTADYGSPAQVVQYINDLKLEFNSLGNKVALLSPMMNQSHPNFSTYVSSLRNINNNFFSQFGGIAVSLYDICPTPLTCDSKYFNPLKVNEVLEEMGAGGKSVFGVESGTAGSNFYWKTSPNSDSPLYKFVSGYLAGSPSAVRMFAIPSYDLAGEVGHSWSLFEPPDVVNLLESAPNGAVTSISPVILPSSLNRCPDKQYTFYLSSIAECTECGTGFSLLTCKPQTADNFGEEYSKQSIDLKETVFYEKEGCVTKEFTANTSASNMSIPFVRNLNEYFLGPYMDNLNARVIKQVVDPMKDFGVFEKLAPKGLQDELRMRFLKDVSEGKTNRYTDFKIQGLSASAILNRFEKIQEKQGKNMAISPDDTLFLKQVWVQVPLFANEEAKGEIVFEGSGISGSIKTSVPEVYRLDKVTTLLAKMMGKNDSVQGIQSRNQAVLSACETATVPRVISNKESISGPGIDVCTSPEIQTSNETLEGTRTYDKSVFDTKNMGGCEGKPENSCCGTGGKCTPKGAMTILGVCSTGECDCKSCDSVDFCWSGGHVPGCKVRETEKTFDVDINIKNRVPFLERIAENTIGKNGFFTFLVPSSKENSATGNIIAQVFRDVAGESQATLDIRDLKKTVPEIGVETSDTNLITLLFYKLGSIVNVRNFVAGVELWPSGQWGERLPGTYEPPVYNISSFEELFNTVRNEIEVPPKILAAVMHIEMPSTFILSPEKVAQYSQEGARLPGCGPNVCSATGPMQMTTGTDDSRSSTCSNCCWNDKCLTSCPNQWAVYGQGDPCNLLDNVFAAARKLKNDSGSDSPTDWTQEQVYQASRRYYGNCTVKYERLGNRTYCEYVWWYYTTQ